ncbi:MAG: peptidylprolyl isomerase, partial [Gammaproteobacteria bacterium]|nr:peptidylprolyl isomerase [Gammaproteobacteria bacterium]
MQFRVLLCSVLAATLLGACNNEQAQSPAKPASNDAATTAANPAPSPKPADPQSVIDTSKVLINVNDKAVTQKALEHFMAQLGRPIHPDPDRAKDLALNEMVKRLLLAQYARDKKLDEELDVYLTLQRQDEQVLIAAARRDILKNLPPVTEDELKAVYEKETAEVHHQEYKVQHIIVDSQEAADNLIAELNKGSDFTALAKKESKGPSKDKGGDLGWVREGQVVPE